MNERIKKLAEQAKIEFTYDPTETPMRAFVECWEDELEKFGELIVAECLDIVEGEDDGSADTKSVRLVMIRMKKHFGVSE